MIDCDYYNNGTCKLGLHGGSPLKGNCLACIKSGENNEKYAKELFERYERSHPSNVARISGCCDSARNYID
jgi:hypothetical protein